MDKNLLTIFSALNIYKYNMRMLHWKVGSTDFDAKHELVDEYRSKMEDYIDEIAEILLIQHQNPLSLPDIIKQSESSKEKFLIITGGEYFQPKKLLQYVNDMFEHLVKLYEVSCNSKENTGDIVSKLQEHQYYFRKECQYKGYNRMQ